MKFIGIKITDLLDAGCTIRQLKNGDVRVLNIVLPTDIEDHIYLDFDPEDGNLVATTSSIFMPDVCDHHKIPYTLVDC